jgi:hypothetical protein
MSTTPEFGTQLIGQTENALGAILDRQLAASGLNRQQWITLTLAVVSGGTIDQGQLVNRVTSALKIGEAQARARIAELTSAGMLQIPGLGDSAVGVTDTGNRLHGQIRTAVTEITQRLWGDLPSDELAIAGRVLGAVLDRANAELGRA